MTRSKREQLEYLDELKDEDIIYDNDSPETDEAFWVDAQVIEPRKKRKQGKSMRFDPDLYAWYEQKAKESGLPTQTFIHQVLKSYREHQKGQKS
jgi:predicted DNA binding CopG/RHH family protein